MTGLVDMTLKSLLQIALGAPQMTKINITVLHSIIDLLLKKLNCEDDTVSIGGYEANCIQRILKESKISPLPLNDERIDMISQKIDRLTELEQRICTVEAKFDNHINALNKLKRSKEYSQNASLHEHERAFEEICSLCDAENEIACNLIHNSAFLQKLTRYIVAPAVERILEYERKVETLCAEVKVSLEHAELEYKKIAKIEGCLSILNTLHTRIAQEENTFHTTMNELQNMLDAKVDKVYIPPFKQYLKTCIEETRAHINKLIIESSCSRAAAVIINRQSYRPDIPNNTNDNNSSMPKSTATNAALQSRIKYCACDNTWVSPRRTNSTIPQRIQEQNITNETPRTTETPEKCAKQYEEFDQIMGEDGQFYRRG